MTLSTTTLADAARRIVLSPDPDHKRALSFETAKAWFGGRLSVALKSSAVALPDRPGRPAKPVLLPPSEMPRRAAGGTSGKVALIHSLAHIELNAVDLTWDLIGRFAGHEPMPRSYFDDFVRVGVEEAKHFGLLSERLKELGAAYGDLPAHDGLWQAAEATANDFLARLAIIPLVLEARGLDVTPSMAEKLIASGDLATADILRLIYRDEKRHVSIGARWFRFLCDRRRIAPEPTFHTLVRRHFRGALKPPFNDRARSEAGLTPGFYKPLVGAER